MTVRSKLVGLRRLERRVRWDSEVVWRYGINAPAVARFHRKPVELSHEAARVLADLKRDGVATTRLEDLTGDPGLLPRLQDHAWELERRKAAEATSAAAPVEGKPFLTELLNSHRPQVAPESLLVEVALNGQLKGIADSYFGLTTRVNDINIWRNIPHETAPSSSQLWHRDIRTDRMMVKAFVYLEPVSETSGPFAYAVGTHPAGDTSGELHTFFDGINDRVRPDRSNLLDSREAIMTGPAGTVVIADMLGYHRGGHVRTDTRFLLQIRYASLASTSLNLLATPAGMTRRPRHSELAYARARTRGRAKAALKRPA